MTILSLFAQPFKTLHLPAAGSFDSQTVIITGSNIGLGLETARYIVSLGASKVILGVRTLSKGNSARVDIEASTGRKGVIEVWEIDLESFDSVKSFASRAKALDRLDTAIMNAGLASQQWNLSPEGWERQIQVNVLSTALLSLLLLPQLVRTGKMIEGAQPHLVLLGSDIHADAEFSERTAENILQELNKKDAWEKSTAGPAERYSLTKLLDLYVAIELARLTPMIDGNPAVIVDIPAPGFCKSDLLTREPVAGLSIYILKALQFLTGRTLEEGSKAIVAAAVVGPEAHGKYFDNQKITPPGTLVTSGEGVAVRKKLWDEIVEVLVAHAPEISQITSGGV